MQVLCLDENICELTYELKAVKIISTFRLCRLKSLLKFEAYQRFKISLGQNY
jgi:hypothetical protein